MQGSERFNHALLQFLGEAKLSVRLLRINYNNRGTRSSSTIRAAKAESIGWESDLPSGPCQRMFSCGWRLEGRPSPGGPACFRIGSAFSREGDIGGQNKPNPRRRTGSTVEAYAQEKCQAVAACSSARDAGLKSCSIVGPTSTRRAGPACHPRARTPACHPRVRTPPSRAGVYLSGWTMPTPEVHGRRG